MSVTELVIHEQAQKRQKRLRNADTEYFQAREAIRTFPMLSDAIIGGFARSYPIEVNYIRYLREIADEQAQAHTGQLAA